MTVSQHDERGSDDRAFDLRIRSGVLRRDPVAMDSLADLCRGPVLAFVRSRPYPGGIAAEDVAQETYLLACRGIAAFDGSGSLCGWLCGIAERLVRRRASSATRWQRALADLAEEEAGSRRELPPDLAVVRTERGRLVREAIERLRTHEREILWRHMAGWTVRDIAWERGESFDRTWSVLRRSLAVLRRDPRLHLLFPF